MKPLIPFLLACGWLGACASSQPVATDGSTEGPTPAQAALQLCVENDLGGYGEVVVYARSARFEVMPGRTHCQALREAGTSIPLRAVTKGGGLQGQRTFNATLNPMHTSCWHWRLSNSPASDYDLMPCSSEQMNQ